MNKYRRWTWLLPHLDSHASDQIRSDQPIIRERKGFGMDGLSLMVLYRFFPWDGMGWIGLGLCGLDQVMSGRADEYLDEWINDFRTKAWKHGGMEAWKG